MKKFNFLLALVLGLAVAVITPSCKKYEDGPGLSLRSKKARVANTWKVDEVIVNGQTQTLSDSDKTERIELSKNGDVKEWDTTDPSTVSTGKWDFASGKDDIIFTFSDSGFTFSLTAKILKLKNNELWVEMTDPNSGDKIETHYVGA